MSSSLDPDQARHFVGPDLGPNCLQISRRLTSPLARRELWSLRFYDSVLDDVLSTVGSDISSRRTSEAFVSGQSFSLQIVFTLTRLMNIIFNFFACLVIFYTFVVVC